jgi:hypothetical protein
LLGDGPGDRLHLVVECRLVSVSAGPFPPRGVPSGGRAGAVTPDAELLSPLPFGPGCDARVAVGVARRPGVLRLLVGRGQWQRQIFQALPLRLDPH